MVRHRVTQADVAALAGVSQPTVSFVLNGNAPSGVRISEETRSRVLEAIRITGYSANPVAQRLAGGRTQILGVFTYEETFPRGGRDFYGGFLNGIEHAAERLGVDMLLFTSARVVDGRRRLTGDGWPRLGVADGCLLLGRLEDQSELQPLLDTHYPFVFIGRRRSEGGRLPYVGADYVAATARQVDRAAALGHARIGCLRARGADQPAKDREEGYLTGVARHGLVVHLLDADDPGTAARAIRDQGITAVLIAPEHSHDDLADALASLGLRVPDDVSLLLLGQPLHPQRGGRTWSGFTVPREEMGARALVLLSRIVADGAPGDDRHQLIDCPDIDGGTLAAAPQEGPLT